MTEDTEEIEREEIEVEEIDLPPRAGPEERLYQVWMAPTCRSIMPSEHLPTFIYLKAANDAEAKMKGRMMAGMTRGIDCACQVQIRRAELYV